MLDRPTKLGPYLLLERISLGGMAEVFKAVEFGVEGFERTVAVKRILPHVAEDEQFIAMFKDEAHIAVQLTHSNIAQIYNLGSERDNFYIALEYVAGRDVRTLFEHGRRIETPMPIGQACYTVMQVCEGLDYAHNKRDKYGRSLNIVHRDVSPPNVLVSYEGEVKLIDFGVAKAAGRVSKTQSGTLKGKFGYMSPEQVRGKPVDRRSDVFALTVVLWEILTGRRLFQGETDFATLDKVRDVAIERPSLYNADIPASLEAVVLKGLAEDVDVRYQSAMELHDALQAYMFESGTMFGRKDLAGWMRTEFAREIELEKEKASKRAELKNPSEGDGDGAAAETKDSKGPPSPPRKTAGAPTPPARGTNPPARGTKPPTRGTKPPTPDTKPPTPDTKPPTSDAKPPTPPGGRTGKRTKTMVMTSTKANVPSKGAPKPPRPKSKSKVSLPPPGGAAAPKKKVGGSDFDWDDEELETRLFDEETHGVPAAPAAKKPPAGQAARAKKGGSRLPPPSATATNKTAGQKTVPPKPPAKQESASENRLPSPVPKPVARKPSSPSSPETAPAVSKTAVLGAAGPAPASVETPAHQGNSTIKMFAGAFMVFALFAVTLTLFTTGGENGAVATASTNSAEPVAAEPVAAEPAAVPTGGVSISLNVNAAAVSIDGVDHPGAGPTRVVGGLFEGNHLLKISADGYLAHESTIQVVAGLAPSVPIKLDPIRVEIAVNAVPTQATLKLLGDGPPTVVTSPVKITRKPGVSYSLEASASGYMPKVAAIEFDGSRTQSLVIALERDPKAAVAAANAAKSSERGNKQAASRGSAGSSSGGAKTAELIIGGMFPGLPPAKISVDGKSYGAKPRVAVKVSAGKHTVKWEWTDGKVATQTVKVGSGDKQKIKASR